MTRAEDAPDPDDDPDRTALAASLRRAVRWLRDLHRGYAYTGHLPRRRE